MSARQESLSPSEGSGGRQGHTHQPERIRGREIHVGLDAWDLAPVNEGAIGKLIAGS
jgi:calcineurin-like phosphoesterase family protein